MTTAQPARKFPRWIKWLALAVIAVALAVPAAGYVFLSTMDMSWLASHLQRQVHEQTGRDLYIKGGMEASFGLSPSLTLREVALSNPSWATGDALFYADRLSLRLHLLPLLNRELDIAEIAADGAKLALEKNASGDASWLLKPERKKTKDAADDSDKNAAADDGEAPSGLSVRVGPIVLTDAEIAYREPGRKTPLTLTIPRLEVHPQQEETNLQTEFVLGDLRGRLTVQGAAFAELTAKPLQIDASLTGARGAQASVKGKIKNIAAQTELYLKAEAHADTLAAFSSLLGDSLPETEALSIRTEIAGSPREVLLNDLEAKYGNGEIGGRARISLGGGKPFLAATLATPSWRLTQDSAPDATAAAPHAPEVPESQRVIPDIVFPSGALGAFGADIEFTAGEIVTRKTTLQSVMSHIVLKEGILQADPLQFKIGGGMVKGRVAFNGNATPPAMQFDVSASGDSLGALLSTLDVTRKLEGGAYRGALSLTGNGESLHAMLPGLAGSVTLVVENAVLKDPKLKDAAGLANLLQGKTRSGDVALTCALGKVNVTSGIGAPEYLVADTKHVRLHGEGTFDLPQELLALTFYPQPKEAGLSELSFPIRLKGSFGDPEITPDKTQAAFSAAKMFSGSKKLRGLEALLGKGGNGKENQDFSGLHPCLKPIETPQDAAPADASDVIDLKKDDVKEGVKAIEKDVRGLRDGLKGLFNK